MSLILDGTTGVPVTTVTGTLPEANGGTGTSTGYYGFKNRIINGAMVIDQRNAGASVTPASAGYTLDRWTAELSQASKFSVQQSSTAPAGFSNSLLVTSTSAYSVLTGDYFVLDITLRVLIPPIWVLEQQARHQLQCRFGFAVL